MCGAEAILIAARMAIATIDLYHTGLESVQLVYIPPSSYLRIQADKMDRREALELKLSELKKMCPEQLKGE